MRPGIMFGLLVLMIAAGLAAAAATGTGPAAGWSMDEMMAFCHEMMGSMGHR
jgi:Spy/CpxP family protein refolding chaperone